MSILLTATTASRPDRPATKRSPGPSGAVASRTRTTTSTPDAAALAVWFRRSPSAVRGRCTPGVSTITAWASGRLSTPRTWVRVVWGLSDTIETLVPTILFTRVDLPTLGRPTSVTKPDLTPPCPSGLVARRGRPRAHPGCPPRAGAPPGHG